MKSVTDWTSVYSSREARVEGIRQDIAKRLRKVCSNLTDVEFAALVDRMIEVQLIGEGRA
jgi:hypothetical protein